MKINSSKSIPFKAINSSQQSIKSKSNKEIKLNYLKQHLKKRLAKKYFINGDKYNLMIINNIVYNKKSKIVAKFKDFLITDEITDFLKKYYEIDQCRIRLKQFLDYYESNSRIYPNYNVLTQSKYIYKNIQKKQKIIDNIQKKEENLSDFLFASEDKRKIIFDKQICYSIMNQTKSIDYKDEISDDNKEENQDETIPKIEKLIQAITKAESQSHIKKINSAHYIGLNEAIESCLSRNKKININKLYTMKTDRNYTKNSLNTNMKSVDKLKLSLNNAFKLIQTNLNPKDNKKIINRIDSVEKNHKETGSDRDFSNDLNIKTAMHKNVANTYYTANYNKTLDSTSSIPNAAVRSKMILNGSNKKEHKMKISHKITMSMPKFNQNFLNILRTNLVHQKSISNGQNVPKSERANKVRSPEHKPETKVVHNTEAKYSIFNKQILISDNEGSDILKKSNRSFAKLIKGNSSNIKLRIKQHKQKETLYDKIRQNKRDNINSLSERQLRINSSDRNGVTKVCKRNMEGSPVTLTKIDQINKMYSTISTFRNLQNNSVTKPCLKSNPYFGNNINTQCSSLHLKETLNLNRNTFKQSNVESIKTNQFKNASGDKLVKNLSKNKIMNNDCKGERKLVKGIKISNFNEIYQNEQMASQIFSERIIRIKHN